MQESVTIRVNTMCEHETPLKRRFFAASNDTNATAPLALIFPGERYRLQCSIPIQFPLYFQQQIRVPSCLALTRTNLFARRSDLSLSNSLDAETPTKR